jgi:hypothetical protein
MPNTPARGHMVHRFRLTGIPDIAKQYLAPGKRLLRLIVARLRAGLAPGPQVARQSDLQLGGEVVIDDQD